MVFSTKCRIGVNPFSIAVTSPYRKQEQYVSVVLENSPCLSSAEGSHGLKGDGRSMLFHLALLTCEACFVVSTMSIPNTSFFSFSTDLAMSEVERWTGKKIKILLNNKHKLLMLLWSENTSFNLLALWREQSGI